MSKKDELLNKGEQRYDLTEEEIVEVASLMALVQQAKAAQDFIYSRIVQNIASRHEIVDKEITLNFDEILEQGAKVAKLVVKD